METNIALSEIQTLKYQDRLNFGFTLKKDERTKSHRYQYIQIYW